METAGKAAVGREHQAHNLGRTCMMFLTSVLRWLTRRATDSQRGGPFRGAGKSRKPALEYLESRTLLSTYDVGPDQAYLSINAVPWESLGPGDTVNIHWRPEAYHEKVLISTSGASEQPIRVLGVPGPAGELPVIDAANATTRSADSYNWAPTQDQGLVVITRDARHPWGYKPSYIDIEGLDLRNATAPNTFTDATGAARAYAVDASSVYVQLGQHVVIHSCTITGSGNGIFVASGGDEEDLSRDMLIDGNSIYVNGTVGSWFQHNLYTEAIGVVFQYNHLGLPRAGSMGGNLKDRSAGTVIRYNWIEGGQHMLDLVEPQDSAAITTQDPSFRQTFVYGNIFINGPGDRGTVLMIHYGGDSGNVDNYRKGTLYFYNNTVVIQANQTGPDSRWRTILFQLETNDESADVRNNLIFCQPATADGRPTELTLMDQAGTAAFGINWVSPGWVPWNTGGSHTGTVTGTENFLVDPNNDPGFVDLTSYDLHLAPDSACIGVGGPLAPAAIGIYDVTSQYVVDQGSEPRQDNGTTLGAFGTPL
jgi:hypothetical protein